MLIPVRAKAVAGAAISRNTGTFSTVSTTFEAISRPLFPIRCIPRPTFEPRDFTFLGSRQIKYNVYSGDLPVSAPVRYQRPQMRPAERRENAFREMQHHGSAVGESGGRIEPMLSPSFVERQLKAEAKHIQQQSVSRRPAAEHHGSRADREARRR